jgi:hypothetical protein
LCRCMWREDKRKFLEIANETRLGLLVRQFEFEDLERCRADSQRR